MSLRFAALLWFLIYTSPLSAHSHHHDDSEQLAEIYQDLTAAMIVGLEDVSGLRENEVFYAPVGVNGVLVPYNRSAMNQLLALALAAEALHPASGRDCNHQCQTGILKKMFRWLKAWPGAAASFLVDPLTEIGKIIRTSEAFLLQTMYGRDVPVAAIIVVSQAAWETIESLFMPGGAHLFCFAFNAALLAAVIPLERLIKFSFDRGTGLPWWRRMLPATKAFLWSTDQWFKKNIVYVKKGEFYQKTNLKSLLGHTHDELEALLVQQGFAGSVGTNIPDPNIGSMMDDAQRASLTKDLATILASQESPYLRFYLSSAIGRGLEMLLDLSEQLSDHLREEIPLSVHEYSELAKLMGRVRRIKTEYTSSLTLAATLSPSQMATRSQQHQEFSALLLGFLNFNLEIAQFLTRLSQQNERDHGTRMDQETIGRQLFRLNQRALDMLKDSKALRLPPAKNENVGLAAWCANLFLQ